MSQSPAAPVAAAVEVNERRQREFTSRWATALVTLICLSFFGIYYYFAAFRYFSPESFVSVYIGFTLVLVFMLYPARRNSPYHRISVFDVALILATVAVTYHYSLYYPVRFAERWGMPDQGDIVFGTIAIVVVLEGCRRTLGLLLPILCAVLIAYALFGPYAPGLARHGGFTFEDLIATLYSSEAIYGTVARVFATFVFLFIVFGACLEMSGGRNLFLNLPLAFLGRTKGGAAKVSIVASAMFGMIAGSAAANVVTTGSLTIPLMKRSGFAPHAAGGFEATASTVGITMPPIMGAAIFVMADFTGIPYIEIVKVSVIPAILFMFSLLLVADLYSRKVNVRALTAEEIGDPWEIVRYYWPFLAPVVILVWLLVGGYSPNYAVFWALPTILLASLLSHRTRMSTSQWLEIVVTGTKRSLTIGALAGCLGIIVGIVVKTGMATKLSYIVIDLSAGSLLLGIILTAVVTFLLGMGVSSVTADYILLSVLVAPALTELGASVIAAHLLIIWYSQTSNLTPPVCTVAFAASAVANANPWRTGFFAFRIGLFIYLIPIAFVIGDLLNFDEPLLLVRSSVTVAFSAVCFAGVVVGYLFGPLALVPRVILGAAMLLLYHHQFYSDLVGLPLMAAVIAWQLWHAYGGGKLGSAETRDDKGMQK